MQTFSRNFFLPSGQNQFIQQNVFKNATIRRIAIAMNKISVFKEKFQENPFLYQEFGLRELRIVGRDRTIVSVDTTNNCRAYVTIMKAVNFKEEEKY